MNAKCSQYRLNQSHSSSDLEQAPRDNSHDDALEFKFIPCSVQSEYVYCAAVSFDFAYISMGIRSGDFYQSLPGGI